MEDAYPLQWPDGWPRTATHRRDWSRFDVTPGKAQQELIWEVERMGGRMFVISTNRQLRRDGLPYASQKEPDDPGVAVYFERKGQRVCFACDKHPRVWGNMRAISKTIEALRGIERWGASEMLDRAFTGFAALPSPNAQRNPWDVLGLPRGSDERAIRDAHRAAIRKVRSRGDEAREVDLNVARDDALAALQQ